MNEPAKYLKCDHYYNYQEDGNEIETFLFDDGSAWIRSDCGWQCIWQPDPVVVALSDPTDKPAEPATTPERPKTITVDELRVGDEVEVQGVRRCIAGVDFQRDFIINPPFPSSGYFVNDEAREYLARGAQVYRDGKLISGWPIESPPWGADAGRIAELESEVKAWKQAANIGSQTSLIGPSDLVCRISEYEERIAALKAQAQEVPPLDWNRTRATIYKKMVEISENERWANSSRLAASTVAHALLSFNGGRITSEPYDVK